jgi:hypothetical protein
MSEFSSGSDFKGWLIKFGSKTLPNKFLSYDNYTATPNQRTEVEAYRDLNNLLHRDTSPNFKTKIEFDTRPLYLAEKIEMQAVFASGLVNRSQRKYNVTYWDDEQNTYKSGVFYMPDVEYKIINVDEETNNILYNKMRFALIEY